MADPQQSNDNTQTPTLDVAATAQRLTELANSSLDGNEMARQIEELTSVVLDSAEVSTRSATIAADISSSMRDVVDKIQENNRRAVLHSRIILGSFVVCLLIAMGIFFAITIKMTKSIKELDTMLYAMAKRVIEVDASISSISKTNADFSEITEKQDAIVTTQTQVANRLEELGRAISSIPNNVADQGNKVNDPKFQSMQKQLQGLESKLLALDGKLQVFAQVASSAKSAPAAAAPNTQAILSELQKIKQDIALVNQAQDKAQMSMVKAAAAAAAAAEKAAASAGAERMASQKAAAEKAVAMRMGQEKSADQLAAEKEAAERAAAARAAAQKAAADRAAADKALADKAAAAAASAEKAATAAASAAEKARAAAASATPVVKDNAIRFPRVPVSGAQ